MDFVGFVRHDTLCLPLFLQSASSKCITSPLIGTVERSQFCVTEQPADVSSLYKHTIHAITSPQISWCPPVFLVVRIELL